MQISKAEHIYLLSERGYSKLIKIMDIDLAWEIHDNLMAEYFELRQEKESSYAHLFPQLQLLINIETEQRKQAKAITDTNTRIDGIAEIVALDTNS